MKCNHDCFNCIYKDCINDDISKEEKNLIEEQDRFVWVSQEIEKVSTKSGYKARHRRYYLSHIEERREYGRNYMVEYRKQGRGKRYPEAEKKSQENYRKSGKHRENWKRYYERNKEELLRKHRERQARKRMKELNVMLDKGAYPLSKGYEDDAGYDIRTPEDRWLKARSSITIDTGIHVEIPKGYVGFIKSKSGLYVKHDIIADGTVDSGYSGSIKVKLTNFGTEDYHFSIGDKITQIVFQKVCLPKIAYVSEMKDTNRGANGFGSTGK